MAPYDARLGLRIRQYCSFHSEYVNAIICYKDRFFELCRKSKIDGGTSPSIFPCIKGKMPFFDTLPHTAKTHIIDRIDEETFKLKQNRNTDICYEESIQKTNIPVKIGSMVKIIPGRSSILSRLRKCFTSGAQCKCECIPCPPPSRTD